MNALLVWIIIGCALISLDLLLGTIVFLLLGISALFVSLILFCGVELYIAGQVILWSFASFVIVFIWFFIKSFLLSKKTLDEAIHQIGYLVSYNSNSNTGIIRFPIPVCSKEEWNCKIKEGVKINLDERVKVVAVDNKNQILIIENE